MMRHVPCARWPVALVGVRWPCGRPGGRPVAGGRWPRVAGWEAMGQPTVAEFLGRPVYVGFFG